MRSVAAVLIFLALAAPAPAAAARPEGVVRVVEPAAPDLAPAPDVDGGRTAFLVERDAVPSWRDPEIAVTYRVGVLGDVAGDVATFGRVAADALNDPEGWAIDGRVAFVPTVRDPDFRLWLAAPSEVAAANAVCDADFSCRVGDDVYINARRWREGTDTYRHRPLVEYRRYVINHEVGHWLGLDHPRCRGVGEQAPVMLQQSKSLDGCEARVEPLDAERRQALRHLRRR